MALFNRQKSNTPPFDKEEIITEIIDAIEEKYPDYAIIAKYDPENPWDILIIRTVSRETKYTIGAYGHERVKQERLQQVFAISVVAPHEPLNDEQLATTASWTTLHQIVCTADAVMRRLSQQ